MKFNEMNWKEQEEVAKKFENWLGQYTQEVIVKVLARQDEILDNEFVMNLISELYERDMEERQKRTYSMKALMEDLDKYKNFDMHNNCMTHASSYRNILFDMYIAM